MVAPDKRSATPDDAVFGNLHIHTCALSAYVLVFSAPLITVILAHFWLKENIQPQLWACVGTGFVGVVICLQPGSAEWHPGLLTALLIGIGHSMLNLLVRQYGQQQSPHALMLTSILTVAGFPSRTSGNLYSRDC